MTIRLEDHERLVTRRGAYVIPSFAIRKELFPSKWEQAKAALVKWIKVGEDALR